jgi:REP element-mobilizing transposase RayT
MNYDPKKHHRRSIRLRGHDYSGGGAYFITICAQDKKCLFGRVAEGEMVLNEAGQSIQRVWEDLPHRFPTVVLDAFQLMPNHLHGILVIPGAGLESALASATGAPIVQPGPKAAGTASQGTASRTPTMGGVVGAFKSIATIEVNRIQSCVGRRLLQENFYEHIIRSVDSLEKIRGYIRQNPVRWCEDPENPDRLPGNQPETEWGWL